MSKSDIADEDSFWQEQEKILEAIRKKEKKDLNTETKKE